MKALLDGDFTVHRYHSSWDAFPEQGVPDSFARQLGLSREIGRGAYTRTYAIEATTLGDLADYVAARLPECPLRTFGNPDRTVRAVGIMVGGFGGNQPNMPEAVLSQGADVVVVGDMSEYTLLNALEGGMAVIETLHSVSEEPAMRSMARLVAGRFPNIRVEYIPSGAHTYGAQTSSG